MISNIDILSIDEAMASHAPVRAKGLVMRIHHLNTGTMCPIGRRLVNGTGSIFQRARMVCHCLLVETDDGLALVDTGIGLDDIADPPRLGPQMGAADDAAARSGRDGGPAGQGARLLAKRRAASSADASRSGPCGRRSGFSESEGACASQGVRDGGDTSDCPHRKAATSPSNGSTVPIGPSMARAVKTGSASRACARSVTASRTS